MVDLFYKKKEKLEVRISELELELRNYTDIVTNSLIEAAVSDENDAYVSALETASGALSRAFTAAIIGGQGQDIFTPDIMGQIGRSLIEQGEAIWYRVAGNNFMRVDNYGLQPDGNYQLNFNIDNPIIADPNRVFHVRWNVDVNTKRGISPLGMARTLRKMANKLETSINDELNASVGYLLPLPTDGDSTTITELKQDIANLKGKIAVIQSLRNQWGDGGMAGSRSEFVLARMGPNIPDTSVNLFREVRNSVLTACGYPITLAENTDGTSQRESWRRYLHGTVAPLGKLVIMAAQRVNISMTIDWSDLFASDITGRARAFQSLVGGGMSIPDAASASGLLIED